MKEILCQVEGAKVTTNPSFKETKDGVKEVYFNFRSQKGTVFQAVAFDDERNSNPYTKIKNMDLRQGKFVNFHADLVTKQIFDEETDFVSNSFLFKITLIDYTVPEEIYREMMEQKKKVVPLTFGKE